MNQKDFWMEGLSVFKRSWKQGVFVFFITAIITFVFMSGLRAARKHLNKTPEQLAEECILKNAEVVTVNGYHVVYDDGVPLTIGNTFNPDKTRKFAVVVINGKNMIQWTQSYGDFLDHIKGTPRIGYQSTNKNFLVKCCIDDATARMLLKQDLDLMYHSVRFKYSPYFDKLNRFQKGALLAYYYEVGNGKQFKLYKLLETRPADAWMGMENADPKKLLEFKKLYMQQEPKNH